MNQHRYFVCASCGRKVTGCLSNCGLPAKEHPVEKVECCAFCAKGGLKAEGDSEEVRPAKRKSARAAYPVHVLGSADEAVSEAPEGSITDVAERKALRKLATQEQTSVLDQKVCKGCGDSKPLTDYYNMASSKDGRQPKCKDCQKKRLATESESEALW